MSHTPLVSTDPFSTVCLYVKVKRYRLPSVKKISVNMPHVISGHTAGGSRVSPGSSKDLFPDHMTEKQIMSQILEAYKNGKIIENQGDRVKVQGQCEIGIIEMWFNTDTKVVETGYPIAK